MTARQVKTPDGWRELPDRLTEIRARAEAPQDHNASLVAGDALALLARVETLEAALRGIAYQYDGLPNASEQMKARARAALAPSAAEPTEPSS